MSSAAVFKPEEDDDPSFWDDSTRDLDMFTPRPVKRARKTNTEFSFPFQLNEMKHDVGPTGAQQNHNVSDTDKEAWLAKLVVSDEDVIAISNFAQGSTEWLNSRKGRITGSNFGAAMGVNAYMSRRGLVKEMLWGGFRGNVATRWGQEHEDVARNEYLENVREALTGREPEALTGREPEALTEDSIVSIDVVETGLVINPERPWMGNSPDGIIHVTYKSGRVEKGLLEIKCPFKKTFYSPDPVPVYYYAQIQGTMGNLNLPWCDFVVWTPTGMQITRVLFDKPYWDTQLLPLVSSFYFDLYMPLAIKKQNGLLATGKIE